MYKAIKTLLVSVLVLLFAQQWSLASDHSSADTHESEVKEEPIDECNILHNTIISSAELIKELNSSAGNSVNATLAKKLRFKAKYLIQSEQYRNKFKGNEDYSNTDAVLRDFYTYSKILTLDGIEKARIFYEENVDDGELAKTGRELHCTTGTEQGHESSETGHSLDGELDNNDNTDPATTLVGKSGRLWQGMIKIVLHNKTNASIMLGMITLATIIGLFYYIRNKRKRRARRRAVYFPAELNKGTMYSSVNIVDISISGARFSPNNDCEVGDAVILKTGDVTLNTMVRWTGLQSVGVQFDRELSKAEMKKLLSLSNEEMPSADDKLATA